MLILLNRLWITYPNVFVPKAANDTRALFYTIENGSHISMRAVVLFGRGWQDSNSQTIGFGVRVNCF
jgi:hypothetical protein